MFNFLLDAANIRQIPHETVSEKLSVGIDVTIRGIATVFAVLVMIWFLVELLHLLLGVKTPKTVKKEEVSSPAPLIETPAEIPVAEAPVVNESDDLALVAVITAAIAVATGSSPNSFRVVSFKRANNKFSSGK